MHDSQIFIREEAVTSPRELEALRGRGGEGTEVLWSIKKELVLLTAHRDSKTKVTSWFSYSVFHLFIQCHFYVCSFSPTASFRAEILTC